MDNHSNLSFVHSAMKDTIKKGFFDPTFLSTRDLRRIQENFSDYMMYIWLSLGDTRCNREGYTSASLMIEDHINNCKELKNAN